MKSNDSKDKWWFIENIKNNNKDDYKIFIKYQKDVWNFVEKKLWKKEVKKIKESKNGKYILEFLGVK